MSLTWGIFLAQARQQKVRFALTVVAMIAAIGVVLWVVSAYEAIAAKFDTQTDEFVGHYSLFVVPQSLEAGLSPELVDSIKNATYVEAANPVTQFRMWFHRVGPPREGESPRGGLGRLGPTVVGTNATEPRYPLVDGRWLNPDSTDETVVSSGVADALLLKPGDKIEFRTKPEETLQLEVVGIVDQVEGVEFAMTRTKGGAPGGFNRGPASLAAYVPMNRVEPLTGEPVQLNLLEIRLAAGANDQQLAQHVAAASPAAELLRPADIKNKIASGFEAEGARKQAIFVTALSILASTFIIFTTLSMGVNERARQLAVLRAVGLRRKQVAQLVLIESLVLAALGWLGGLVSGGMLLKIVATTTPELFPQGVSLGGLTILLTALCSLVGALLASIYPLSKAIQISPLEAMAPSPAQCRHSRWYALVSLASVGLIMLNPFLVYAIDLSETVRFALILLVGIPSTVLGFVLLAPSVVIFVERIFSPAVAAVFRLQSPLIESQLSTNMWRTTGIAASLVLGLGLYTSTQVWGHSMLGGFLPGHWTPDTIVVLKEGIEHDQADQLRTLPGVIAERFLPLAVEQTKLAGDPLKSAQRDSAVRQNNVVLVGLNAQQAFASNETPFELTFIEGNREEALAKLASGRHCLVPETFQTIAGLGVGDTIGLIPPNQPDETIEYTIVGVVAMPGSNWITKTSGMRRHSVRTAGLVFAPEEQVRHDFDLPKVEYFWLDRQPGIATEQLQQQIRSALFPAPVPNAGSLAEAGTRPERRGGGPGPRAGGGPRDDRVRVTSISEVREGMRSRGGAAVAAMGWLPLVTLVIVSLGIVNTIAASVRTRRWEFGILRAIGLRRLALSKLVISEALLIGCVASLLSLAFGILTGWTCLGLVGYVSNAWFEGIKTPLVIPWSALAFGYALTFVLCFAAALWPAITSGRTEPLRLLQAGRSAT